MSDPGVFADADFGRACSVANSVGAPPSYSAGAKGKAVLNAHDPAWRAILHSNLHLDLTGNPSEAYDQFKKWLSKSAVSSQLAALLLNVAFGSLDGNATIADPVAGDWPTVTALIARVGALQPADAERYRSLIEKLNKNTAPVTPPTPAACGSY